MPVARYVPSARERTACAWCVRIFIGVLSTTFANGKHIAICKANNIAVLHCKTISRSAYRAYRRRNTFTKG